MIPLSTSPGPPAEPIFSGKGPTAGRGTAAEGGNESLGGGFRETLAACRRSTSPEEKRTGADLRDREAPTGPQPDSGEEGAASPRQPETPPESDGTIPEPIEATAGEGDAVISGDAGPMVVQEPSAIPPAPPVDRASTEPSSMPAGGIVLAETAPEASSVSDDASAPQKPNHTVGASEPSVASSAQRTSDRAAATVDAGTVAESAPWSIRASCTASSTRDRKSSADGAATTESS